MPTEKGKHTGLPWKADTTPRNDLMGNSWVISNGRYIVASLGMERLPGSEHAANAALIVRAVNNHANLVEALREVVRVLRANPQTDAVTFMDAVEKAEAALKPSALECEVL